MRNAKPRRPMILSALGFALTTFAFATGFGPAKNTGNQGGGTQSIVITSCYDIVTQNQGFCRTTDCFEVGCEYHYDCSPGLLTLAIAGNTWADVTEGPLYSLTCTQCNTIDLAGGGCKKGGSCTDNTYTFKTPVGTGGCMVCCF